MKQLSPSLCVPRWATERSPERETLGPALAEAARVMGTPLMPWQQLVADVGLELDSDGVPAYREVVISVPRQSGKTTTILSWEVQRAIGWAERLGVPQRIAYSAQTGADARSKLLDDQVPILEKHRRVLGLGRVMRSNGHESVSWRNGSKLDLLASSEDAGHGRTLDLAILDELFADKDHRRSQALIPAMATRPHAQKVSASTAGTPDSVAWNAALTDGRASVEADLRHGVAFFEWSASDDMDPADPATWWTCMPALGRTITLGVVERAYASMTLGEFRRAFTNVGTAGLEQIIPAVSWDLVNDVSVEATAAVFGLDVNPERAAGCLVAAGSGPVLEVVAYRAGTAWIVEECVRLHEKYRAPFVIDSTGPVAGFGDDLERAGLTVVRLTARDVANASGRFYDRVVNGTVKVRRDADLDRAVAGASKRLSGDAWAWSRKATDVDICPLVAATVALWQVDSGAPDVVSSIW